MANPYMGPQHLEQVQQQFYADGVQATTAFSTIHLVMFPIAQDYFARAHKYSTRLCSREDVLAYYKLVATGTQCYEAVLKERTMPYVECLAALWYCEALFSEGTKGFDEAEEVLNKAIALAGRNNLHDIKFTMLHLSIRMLSHTNARAGQRLLQQCLREAETTGTDTWTYTFIYLRSTLHLNAGDYVNALTSLRPLLGCTSSEVRNLGYMTSALVSLRQQNFAAATGFLSQARSCESDYTRTYIPQLVVMRKYYDALTVLMSGGVTSVVEEKLKAVHEALDGQPHELGKWRGWSDEGLFYVLLPAGGERSTTAIPLQFKWWCQAEVYLMAYLISGCMHLNTSFESRKAQKYFLEGLKVVDYELHGKLLEHANDDSYFPSLTIHQAAQRTDFLSTARSYLQFYLCLESFTRGEWNSELLIALVNAVAELDASLTAQLSPLTVYICGLYFQATGKLGSALEAYAMLRQSLMPSSELAILASMAIVVIFRGDTYNDGQQAADIARELEPIVVACPRYGIRATWALVNAVHKSPSPIAPLLSMMKELANTQLMGIALHVAATTATDREQKSRASQAAFATAKRTQNALWCYVSGSLAADMLRLEGKELSAEVQRETNEHYLPLAEQTLNQL
ncbi:cohesin loading factor [Limtongia smithiae]|uniref:cohesin loading factor n=1 Tax=Limtongia smithiae TaxID=1125753 RepID=UPI0034CE269E